LRIKECAAELTKAKYLELVLRKDPAGFAEATRPAIAATETAPPSQTASSVSTASDTVPPIVAVVSVVLTKGKESDGLGLTINSAADGSPGTYFTKLTPGGVASTALKAAGGLGVDDGLQIVEINGVDTTEFVLKQCFAELTKNPKAKSISMAWW